jgi:hypothetical protein
MKLAEEEPRYIPIFYMLLKEHLQELDGDSFEIKFSKVKYKDQVGVSISVNGVWIGDDYTHESVSMLCSKCGPISDIRLANDVFYCQCGLPVVSKHGD